MTDSFFLRKGTALKLPGQRENARKFFDQVTPDPTVGADRPGYRQAEGLPADLVVALGGGSPMDAAKAMVYFSGEPIPLAAIPTTSGSGAEVTDFAIITHNEVKHPWSASVSGPRLQFWTVSYWRSCPGASLPMQALTSWPMPWRPWRAERQSHYGCPGPGRLLHSLFPAAGFLRWGALVRLPIHLAATMAAMAFPQAGLGICHALAHSLGGQFHVPHGRLNAILLPAVVACNGVAAGAAYTALARQAGLGALPKPLPCGT